MGWLNKYWEWRTHRHIDFVFPMTVYDYVTYLENHKTVYTKISAGGKIYVWYRHGYRDIDVEAHLAVENVDNHTTRVYGVMQPTIQATNKWKGFIYFSSIGLLAGLFDWRNLFLPVIMLLFAILDLPLWAQNRQNYLLYVITNGHDISATPVKTS